MHRMKMHRTAYLDFIASQLPRVPDVLLWLDCSDFSFKGITHFTHSTLQEGNFLRVCFWLGCCSCNTFFYSLKIPKTHSLHSTKHNILKYNYLLARSSSDQIITRSCEGMRCFMLSTMYTLWMVYLNSIFPYIVLLALRWKIISVQFTL